MGFTIWAFHSPPHAVNNSKVLIYIAVLEEYLCKNVFSEKLTEYNKYLQ